MIKILCLLLLTPWFVRCGSNIGTNSKGGTGGTGLGNLTTSESFAAALVRLNLFSLGNDFPTDIVIPDIDGMRSTAFIAGDNPTLGVVPVDLDTLKFSVKFAGLDATSPGVANTLQYARRILILSPTQALFLGGAGLVYFNPTTGSVLQTLSLNQSINLVQPLQLSRPADVDGNGTTETSVSGTFTPNFAGSMAIVDNRLFVTMSNLFFDGPAGSPGYFAQGILLVFDLAASPPFIRPANPSFLVLDGFNPTGLTDFRGDLLVTIGGATELFDGGQSPLTVSKIIRLDPGSFQATGSLNLGLVAANDRPLAVTEDGTRAFLGSSAFSEVYEINPVKLTVLRGENNPIVLSNLSSDFVTGQLIADGGEILFISSYNRSVVQAVDLTDPALPVLSHELNFAIEPNPGVTGAGPMALRPGIPGVDFLGPDLWVLTGSPGTLSSALTY